MTVPQIYLRPQHTQVCPEFLHGFGKFDSLFTANGYYEFMSIYRYEVGRYVNMIYDLYFRYSYEIIGTKKYNYISPTTKL